MADAVKRRVRIGRANRDRQMVLPVEKPKRGRDEREHKERAEQPTVTAGEQVLIIAEVSSDFVQGFVRSGIRTYEVGVAGFEPAKPLGPKPSALTRLSYTPRPPECNQSSLTHSIHA